MRKTILAMLIMICILSGCDYGPEVEKYNGEKKTETTAPKETEEKAPEIYNDLEIKFDIHKDEFGEIEITAIYKNNSEYAISDLEIKGLLKDNNTSEIFDCSDTVLPGETSPKFEAMLIDIKKESSVEVLEARIEIKDKDGNERYILYDNKLKIHEYTVI